MYSIILYTKFSSIQLEFICLDEKKILNHICNFITEIILLHKQLYTDGARQAFWSNTKVKVWKGNELQFNFAFMPSENKFICISRIAWELRNVFPNNFSKFFKTPYYEGIIFNKKDHHIYVKKWLENKCTNKEQKKTSNKNKLSKLKKKNVWHKIVYTPMQN